MTIDPLYGPIQPESSTFSVTPRKIEITLKMATVCNWSALEGKADAAPITASTNVAPAQASGPAYPTSSRSGPKNWDKIFAESSKKKENKDKDKEKEKDEDQDDDLGYDSDDGGDPANAFFKKLYANADPDTRRAMMKSYQESNGTALSTDWSSVSKGKVETQPPDGMEAKKWGA
jgi:suppressor of G2 allele of SKP1